MKTNTSTLPPGPRRPPIAQLAGWLHDPLRFLRGVRKRHGPIFTLRLPRRPPMILMSGPEHIRMLFTDKRFVALEQPEFLPIFGPGSILSLDAAAHRQRRKVIARPLNGAHIARWGQSIVDMTRACMRAHPPGAIIPVRPLMAEITLNVMLQLLFGDHDTPGRQRIRRLVGERLDLSHDLLAGVGTWFPLLTRLPRGPWVRVPAIKRELGALFDAEIRASRESDQPPDANMLSQLCASTDPLGQPLDDTSIRSELMALLVAGYENTAATLAWAVHWLCHRPDVRQRVRAALDGRSADATPSETARVPELVALFSESMRLNPPVMMTLRRETADDIEIGDYTLPRGTLTWGSIYLTQHDPAVWPDPGAFRLDRFIDDTPDRYRFLPFGGGVRQCLGKAFAFFEMALIIAEIEMNSRIEAASPGPVRPVLRSGLLAPDPSFAIRYLGPADGRG